MKINFDVSPYSMHSMSAVTAAPSPPPTATKMMMYAKLPIVYIFRVVLSELDTAYVFLRVS